MDEIEQMIREAPALVAVAFCDLHTGRELFVQADEALHPASTFKVGVMMEVFHQAAQGKFSLDDDIAVVNSFTSVADGLPYSVQVEDDAETTLYGKIGETEHVREVVRLMIVRSSNLGTNILMEKVGAKQTDAYLQELGIEGVRVLRGVEDNRAFRRA